MPTPTQTPKSSSSSSLGRLYFIVAPGFVPLPATKAAAGAIVTECGKAPDPTPTQKKLLKDQDFKNLVAKDKQYDSVGLTVVGQITRAWVNTPAIPPNPPRCVPPPGGFLTSHDEKPLVILPRVTISCDPVTGALSGYPTNVPFGAQPSQGPASDNTFCIGGLLGVGYWVTPVPDPESGIVRELTVTIMCRGGWKKHAIATAVQNGTNPRQIDYDQTEVDDHPPQKEISFSIKSQLMIPDERKQPCKKKE